MRETGQMRYVRRDADGGIVAVSLDPMEGFEPVAADDADVVAFGSRFSGPQSRFAESDREVVRVLDDLVNVLIEKNLIRFTDLPPAAQRKLMERRGLRENGTHLGLLGEDTALF